MKFRLLVPVIALFLPTSLCMAAGVPADDAPAWSAQDMLKPDMFPNAQYGMAVESIEDGQVAKVVTTGAEFLIDKAKDSIECKQRIAKQRSVGVVKLAPGTLKGMKLTHKSSGAAIFSGNGSIVRINGDSMLMIQPAKDGAIKAALSFTPDYHSEFVGNYNFYDPYGGIGFYEHGKCPNSRMEVLNDPVTVTWPWKGGDILWVSVSPPKPYDWTSLGKRKINLHGSEHDRWMYPCDSLLGGLSKMGNELILFSENMWEHWQLSLVPRNMTDYLRTMRTAHEFGMKTVVYASPKMFTKGTVVEYRANPDVHLAGGWHTGSNEREYLKQATRIIKEFETDGLYFDEMYCSRKALATSYHLARASRELVGDNGLLYFHCTEDVLSDRRVDIGEQSGQTACPTIHAYFDMLLKGEGEYTRIDPAYVRYVLSSYNISNTMTLQCTDDRVTLTPERLDFWLSKANVGVWFQDYLLYRTSEMDVYRKFYWPKVSSENLKRQIEPHLLRPIGVFDAYRYSIKRAIERK